MKKVFTHGNTLTVCNPPCICFFSAYINHEIISYLMQTLNDIVIAISEYTI